MCVCCLCICVFWKDPLSHSTGTQNHRPPPAARGGAWSLPEAQKKKRNADGVFTLCPQTLWVTPQTPPPHKARLLETLENKQEVAQQCLRPMAKFLVRLLCLPLAVQNNELFSADALLVKPNPDLQCSDLLPFACCVMSLRSRCVLP